MTYMFECAWRLERQVSGQGSLGAVAGVSGTRSVGHEVRGHAIIVLLLQWGLGDIPPIVVRLYKETKQYCVSLIFFKWTYLLQFLDMYRHNSLTARSNIWK